MVYATKDWELQSFSPIFHNIIFNLGFCLLPKLPNKSSNSQFPSLATGSSSGSAEQIYLPPRHRKYSSKSKGSEGHQKGRPLTSRLDRPSNSDLDVPNIRFCSKPKSLKARLSLQLKSEVRKVLTLIVGVDWLFLSNIPHYMGRVSECCLGAFYLLDHPKTLLIL